MAQTKKRRASVAAVILAAGKGKRLGSATPKVLHPIVGRPALWHVLRAATAADPDRIAIVIGHGGDQVRAAVEGWGIRPKPVFVEQGEQMGTGHATRRPSAPSAGRRRCWCSPATTRWSRAGTSARSWRCSTGRGPPPRS
ncbi:MAG: NTP transferase domain-containing protein [Actinomycetota bacterium]